VQYARCSLVQSAWEARPSHFAPGGSSPFVVPLRDQDLISLLEPEVSLQAGLAVEAGTGAELGGRVCEHSALGGWEYLCRASLATVPHPLPKHAQGLG
jgi:hypothetical protein